MQRNRVGVEPEPTLQDLQHELQQAQTRAQALEARLSGQPSAPVPPLQISGYPPQQIHYHQPLPPIYHQHALPPGMPPMQHQPSTVDVANMHHGVETPRRKELKEPAKVSRSAKKEQQEIEDRRAAFKRVATTWGLCIVSTVLYLTAGGVIYTQVEGWDIISSVYFSMVTMSTVGYGDLSPSTDAGKVLTILMILVGVVAIFTQLANALGMVIGSFTAWGRSIMEMCFPRKLVDIDGDGEADFSYPRYFLVFYFKGFFPSLLLNLVVQAISASVFVGVEGWGYGDAIYHCMVTATTVGYGDIAITTDSGRIWACFHILISVIMVAEGISTIGVLQSERASELERLEQLNRKLDANMLDDLLETAEALRSSDDAAPVTDMHELEFVVAMMLQLEICTWSQVKPFIKKFRALDADGSGKLGKEDLQVMVSGKYSTTELAKLKPAAPAATRAPPPQPQYVPSQAPYFNAPVVSPNRGVQMQLPSMPPPVPAARYAPNYAHDGYPYPGGSQAQAPWPPAH